MTRARWSDSLSILIAEVVDTDGVVNACRADEDLAKQDFIVARQALDAASAKTKAAVSRHEATVEALDTIARRDDISTETLQTLISRARAS